MWFVSGKNHKGNSPLKVSDVVERDDVLGMLYMLKDNVECKKINITEDLKEDERNTVKSWLNLVKQKNDKEPQNSSFVWRLQRRIKTGFYLKKIEKTNIIV